MMKPIGIIRSPHASKEECPLQPLYAADALGYVELFQEYEAGLKDLDSFSHIYLFYLFDRAGEVKLIRQTFLDDEERGIFATRHPCRPNPIGMSIVRLKKRMNNILEVMGIDVLDNTPLLDIKPYIPRFDLIATASEGWTANVSWRPKPKGRE
jgi:tRNA (adenine37-N6)-methyltransferase